MKTCQVYVPFAILAMVYIIASGYYVIATRKIGTPFNDALKNYPELVVIKQQSAKQRWRIFYEGLVIAVFILLLLKYV
jgi:hypothetical protein